jgi:uncharacterized membrane protein YphA (DoxX/SURF4 family)
MKQTQRILFGLLRVAIGWHFLYEGVFKIGIDDAWQPPPTSRYFVRASVERLQREAAGATPDAARERMRQWTGEVAQYFQKRGNPLGEEQKTRLAMLRDAKRPDEIDWTYVHDEVLAIAPAPPLTAGFTAEPFLRGTWGPFRPAYRALISDVDGLERLDIGRAVAELETRYDVLIQHYGFDGEQRASLARVRDGLKRDMTDLLSGPDLSARIADYRLMRASLRDAERQPPMPFAGERTETLRKRADDTALVLLSYVTEPPDELTFQAGQIATVAQLKAGPPEGRRSRTAWSDRAVKWGLVGIGVLLIVGIGTVPAALGAAAMLAMFYFAAPPWPGLPAPPGEGHYLFVDRNLIELLAVLLIAKGLPK